MRRPFRHRFSKRTLPWLPKVKSRGHVYPLSYLPYFEDSSPGPLPSRVPYGVKLHGNGLRRIFNSALLPERKINKRALVDQLRHLVIAAAAHRDQPRI